MQKERKRLRTAVLAVRERAGDGALMPSPYEVRASPAALPSPLRASALFQTDGVTLRCEKTLRTTVVVSTKA